MSTDRNVQLDVAQLDTEGNILTKIKNPFSGLGGDAIKRNVYRRTDRRIIQSQEGFLF